MPEEEESAASIPRLWLPFLSLGWLYCLHRWDLFCHREGFAFIPKDNHPYWPSLLQLLCYYSPFLGHSESFKLSLAIRWQCRFTNPLSSWSPWKTILLLVEWLVEPQIFYFCLPHLLRLRYPEFVSPANEWSWLPGMSAPLESSVAWVLSLSLHLGPSFAHRVNFFALPAINSFVSCFAASKRYFAVLLVSQLTAKPGRQVSHGLLQAKPWRIDFFLGSWISHLGSYKELQWEITTTAKCFSPYPFFNFSIVCTWLVHLTCALLHFFPSHFPFHQKMSPTHIQLLLRKPAGSFVFQNQASLLLQSWIYIAFFSGACFKFNPVPKSPSVPSNAILMLGS